MIEYLKAWAALKTDQRGVTALEYGVIAAAIIAVVAGTVFSLGTSLDTMFQGVAGHLTGGGGTATPPA